MQQRLTYITFGVNSIKIMRDFYQNIFGWKPEKSSNDSVVFFKLNGIVLSLFGRDALAEDAQVHAEGNGFKSFSLAYNVRSEMEVDDLFKELTAKGVKALKKPQKAFWGGYTCYIADPEDNLWEIAYNPYLKMDENGNAK